jgi:hypothetical protein
MTRLSIPLALLLAAPASAQAPAPFVVVGSGQSFETLQEAVAALQGGDGTIRIAAGTYDDCAVVESGSVAFVAGTSGEVIFDGGVCENKATLVLRGRSARVEGLTFTHTEVDDGNGAGIRLTTGDLVVVGSKFIDAQSGILSGIDPSGTISIDRSTFSGLGKDPTGNGAHSIYIGDYGAVKVTNSRFERGTGGHYLKSRAARIDATGNSFDDSQGRNTNYMIDLPNGAIGRIAGNMFVNGLDKDNYGTMIAVAAEERIHSSAGLIIEHNRAGLAPGFPQWTAFVGNWSKDALVIRDNEIARRMTMLADR